jgi:hypothetical protein
MPRGGAQPTLLLRLPIATDSRCSAAYSSHIGCGFCEQNQISCTYVRASFKPICRRLVIFALPISLVFAGAAGFFILIQSGERPDR